MKNVVSPFVAALFAEPLTNLTAPAPPLVTSEIPETQDAGASSFADEMQFALGGPHTEAPTGEPAKLGSNPGTVPVTLMPELPQSPTLSPESASSRTRRVSAKMRATGSPQTCAEITNPDPEALSTSARPVLDKKSLNTATTEGHAANLMGVVTVPPADVRGLAPIAPSLEPKLAQSRLQPSSSSDSGTSIDPASRDSRPAPSAVTGPAGQAPVKSDLTPAPGPIRQAQGEIDPHPAGSERTNETETPVLKEAGDSAPSAPRPPANSAKPAKASKPIEPSLALANAEEENDPLRIPADVLETTSTVTAAPREFAKLAQSSPSSEPSAANLNTTQEGMGTSRSHPGAPRRIPEGAIEIRSKDIEEVTPLTPVKEILQTTGAQSPTLPNGMGRAELFPWMKNAPESGRNRPLARQELPDRLESPIARNEPSRAEVPRADVASTPQPQPFHQSTEVADASMSSASTELASAIASTNGATVEDRSASPVEAHSASAKSAAELLPELRAAIPIHAVEFRQSKAEAITVVLRPDTETALQLQLSSRDGQVDVCAQLEHGNFHVLNSQWSELQESLATQGIRLGDLQESNVASFGGETPDMFGRSRQELEMEMQNADSDLAEREAARRTSFHANSPQSNTRPASSSRTWESWA